MTDTNLEARLLRLNQQAPLYQAQHAAPTIHKTRSRKQKLALALAHLERGGITGSYAYTPLFRALSRIGIVIKPLHYRSWIGLMAIFMILMVLIAILVLVAVAFTGTMPRVVATAIDLGPQVFFGSTFVLSILFAGLHKFQARQIGLPRWRDL